MRKNFGAKPWVYPQPVFIVAAYDKDGTADAMNAAWGCISGQNRITMFLGSRHKTVENILATKAFTVSMADTEHIVQCDYVGVESGNDVTNKMEKSGFTTEKAEFVNAPIICELPMAMECKLISYDKSTCAMTGEIINVNADQKILDEKGSIDPAKFTPIIFDSVNGAYLKIGEKAGNAFKDGLKLK